MALSQALYRLSLDAGLRHRMGQAGRDKVLKEFDENIVIEKTLEVYDELLPDFNKHSVVGV